MLEQMHSVLFVEDDDKLREATQVALTRDGFDVRATADGAAGLAAFDDRAPDLALLDVACRCCDVEANRIPLSSHGWPGVAVTPQQVYVALRTGRSNTVAMQTRDPDGAIVGQSQPLRLTGAFQSRPLAGCHGSIFGWTRSESGAALFRVDAAGHALTYSQRLPPRERDHPSKLTAIAFDKNCRSIWVATVNRAAGVVSLLRASSLELTGRLETLYVGTLVWTHMSLWASDLVHHAILRIR